MEAKILRWGGLREADYGSATARTRGRSAD